MNKNQKVCGFLNKQFFNIQINLHLGSSDAYLHLFHRFWRTGLVPSRLSGRSVRDVAQRTHFSSLAVPKEQARYIFQILLIK